MVLLQGTVGSESESIHWSTLIFIGGIHPREDKYGKDSDVVKACNIEILELPVISGVNVKKNRLIYCLHFLETMEKLVQVNGNVSMTLDKLPGIEGDLVRTDDGWKSWDLVKLCQTLRLQTRRNPFEKWDPLPRRRASLSTPEHKSLNKQLNKIPVFIVITRYMSPGSAQR